MTVIRDDALAVKTVSSRDAAAGAYTSPIQVIGKVLSVPVVAGQAFTKRIFVVEGTGIQLAAALKEGMRAVSVSLSDYGGLQGLLYPGSVVDVLASFKRPTVGTASGEGTSITLLRGIQVLGVENETIVSAESGEEPSSPQRGGVRNRKWQVTLMVTPEQAQMLQLVMEYGIIGLSLRNPLDGAAPADAGPITLSRLLRHTLQPPIDHMQSISKALGSFLAKLNERKQCAPPAAPAKPRTWEIEIHRGGRTEQVSFPHPENRTAAAATESTLSWSEQP
jgi:pilus assembly protein CpaB